MDINSALERFKLRGARDSAVWIACVAGQFQGVTSVCHGLVRPHPDTPAGLSHYPDTPANLLPYLVREGLINAIQ